MKIKDTFAYSLWDVFGKWILAIIILLFIFHDGCPRKKVVKMKEDVLYIKPTNK